MDLKLTEEEKLIKETAAQFVDKELIAREGEYLKQSAAFLPPGDPPRRDLDKNVRDRLETRAREVGLWALELPENVGGAGASNVSRVLIHREFGRSILPFAPVHIAHALAETPYCDGLLRGETSLALAFDECHRSGDLTGLTVLYREESDSFTLRDRDLDLLQPDSSLILLPVKEQGTHRIALFLLDRSIDGVSISAPVDLTTDAMVGRLNLQRCKVPLDRCIGYDYEAGATMAAEQLNMAARCLGIGMRCLAATLEHARNRITFGRRLAERQAIQWMVADLSMDLRTCTWLTLEAAWRADQGQPYFEGAALAKKRAAKMAFTAADIAIQVHGGYGVCKEFPFEGFYREARMMRLLYGREAERHRMVGENYLSQ